MRHYQSSTNARRSFKGNSGTKPVNNVMPRRGGIRL